MVQLVRRVHVLHMPLPDLLTVHVIIKILAYAVVVYHHGGSSGNILHRLVIVFEAL